MGSLAARKVAESDWTSVWQAVVVYIFSSWHRTPRRRSRLALTLKEREEISTGIAAQRSARLMARLLGHYVGDGHFIDY